MVDEYFPVIEFNAQDRCDRCGAQACTIAAKDSGELLFCAHHSREVRQKLFDDGWTITDDAAGLEALGFKMPELVV